MLLLRAGICGGSDGRPHPPRTLAAKWLSDFADTQVYDNRTMNSDGALPDCIPFYGHGNTDSDPGWGFAAWSITDWFSDYC